MKTQATARYVRVPASKARLVLDHIRGKSVGDALATLQFTPKAAGRLIEKVLRSAIANAEHNHQVRNLDDLRVTRATADGGPSAKRVLLAFNVPGLTVVVFKPSAPTANTDGVGLRAESGLFIMRYEDFGELVHMQWQAFAQGAGQFATVVEVMDEG